MKPTRCFFIMLALVLFLMPLTGCQGKKVTSASSEQATSEEINAGKEAGTVKPDAILAENENYTLRTVSGAYYLTWKDKALSTKTEEPSGQVQDVELAALSFASVDELIEKIQNNSFTKSELDVIKTFPKDENGIKIPNIDQMFDAVYPDGTTRACVYWYSEEYSFLFNSPYAEGTMLHVKTQKSFQTFFEDEYTNLFKKFPVTSQKHSEDQNADEFYYQTSMGKFKEVRYTLPSGDLVAKRFCLESIDPDLLTSETLPIRVSVYHNGEDCCYILRFLNTWSRGEKQELSDEILNAFSLKAK